MKEYRYLFFLQQFIIRRCMYTARGGYRCLSVTKLPFDYPLRREIVTCDEWLRVISPAHGTKISSTHIRKPSRNDHCTEWCVVMPRWVTSSVNASLEYHKLHHSSLRRNHSQFLRLLSSWGIGEVSVKALIELARIWWRKIKFAWFRSINLLLFDRSRNVQRPLVRAMTQMTYTVIHSLPPWFCR